MDLLNKGSTKELELVLPLVFFISSSFSYILSRFGMRTVLSVCLSHYCFVCSFASRFGGYLVSIESAQIGDVITVFFSILIGAFYVGQIGPFIQKIAEACGVAGFIYDVIDRVRL